MQLNEKQQYAYEQVLRGQNLFISGPGGVGKSVLVHKIRDNLEDGTIFLAPTGIASQNIQGSTIHRTFKLPLGFLGKSARSHVNQKTRELFEGDQIKRIVIDEISMVRADVFTAIDRMLRSIKKKNVPFGGLQIIVVGDFFQLPPVLKERSQESEFFYEDFTSIFAFDTDSWRDAGFHTIELTQIMRQSDKQFIFALNSIRQKDENSNLSLKFLNKIGSQKEQSEDTIVLCSTNADADTVNKHHYDLIDSEEKIYYGEKSPNYKDAPVPMEIPMKVGMKVLICANSPEETYYNGQTGVITRMTDNSIFVKCDDEVGEVVVTRFTWQEYEYSNVNGNIMCMPVGKFVQFPIKYGYALTIHKCQGLSLAKAVIYTGRGCFAHGQAYVAFSRVRTLDGLSVMENVGYNEIIVDSRVKKFYDDNKYSNLMNMV